jgi:hypothetical protein
MPNNIIHGPQDEKHWDTAKSKVLEEYPNVKEGSDDFYKITMGIYKKMSKSASGEDIINNLKAEGVLSKNAVDKYRDERQYLDIVSKLFTFQEEKVATLAEDFGKGLLIGGGTALAGLGVAGANKGIQRYLARKGRPGRMKDIIKFSPIVKEMDPALVNEGMRTLENYNPEMAKHPLIAGSFLKSIHNYGGVTPEQANILKGNKGDSNDLVRTLGEGVGTATKYNKGGIQDLTKAYELLNDEEKTSAKKKLMKKLNSADETKEAGFKETIKNMGYGALAAGAGVAGLAAVGKGGSMIYNKLSREGRLNAVKEFSPELKKANPKLLNAGMKTLERLSPQVSRDPLAAGGFLKQIIKGKGLKPTGTKDIVDTANRENKENPFLTAGKILGKDL